MFPGTADHAFRRFQRNRDPAALATVFDRTAPRLLRLARHLAMDESAAEDLVQATFVTAIEAVDDYDAGQRVLPWLLGILANHARVARRRSKREPEPERLGTAPTVDPARDAEERELRAELVSAIARLPEVYRPVLRLHLEQGMSSKEIARTLERPPGTVRAQITRGLQLVRRALPAGLTTGAAIASRPGRGLEAVRAAVLGRWLPRTGGAVPSLSTGAILMLHKNLVVALSAALLLLIGGTAALLPGPAEDLPAAQAAGSESARIHAPPAAEPAPTASNEREVATPPAPEETEEREAARPETGALRVRVTRPGDPVPAAGIGVAVRDFANLQDPAYEPRFVRTDPRGEVVFTDLPPASYMIELDRAGRTGVATVEAGEETLHETVLAGGVTVEGAVVDVEGNPVPGAAIVLHGARMGSVQVAESDGAGRFRARDLAEHTELQARKPGRVPSLAHSVRGQGKAVVTMRLVLQGAGHRVRGRVTDPSGQTVAGASVAVLPSVARDAPPVDRDEPRARAAYHRTDDAGVFVCDEAAAGTVVVLAHAGGLGTAPAVEEVKVEGDTWVELRLPSGGTIEGRITRDGAPLAGVDVTAFVQRPARTIGELGNLLGMRRAATGPDGTYRIEGLMPGAVHLRASRGLDGLGETLLEVEDGGMERWDLTLGAATPLRVEVVPPLDPDNRGPWMVLLTIPSQSKVRMGMVRDGVVEFADLPDADCRVEIVRMQRKDIIVLAHRHRLRAGQEVEIDIPEDRLATCNLRGRLVDDVRAPIEGATVTVTASGNGPRAFLERTTAEDGTFESGTLPPGSYRVTLRTAAGKTRDGGTHALTAGQDLDLGDLLFDR